MLTFKSDRGTVEYDYEGDTFGIMADLMCVINCLYEDFVEHGDGGFYRSFLEECVNDGSAFTKDGSPEVRS